MSTGTTSGGLRGIRRAWSLVDPRFAAAAAVRRRLRGADRGARHDRARARLRADQPAQRPAGDRGRGAPRRGTLRRPAPVPRGARAADHHGAAVRDEEHPVGVRAVADGRRGERRGLEHDRAPAQGARARAAGDALRAQLGRDAADDPQLGRPGDVRDRRVVGLWSRTAVALRSRSACSSRAHRRGAVYFVVIGSWVRIVGAPRRGLRSRSCRRSGTSSCSRDSRAQRSCSAAASTPRRSRTRGINARCAG